MKLKVASERRAVVLLSEIATDMLSPSLWSPSQKTGLTMGGYRRVQSLERVGNTFPEASTLSGQKARQQSGKKAADWLRLVCKLQDGLQCIDSAGFRQAVSE
ncbi:MAG TPA: hypothetical protein PKA30_00175 [Accumulibacter sp.]|uniref:hypothetical protein n=1 Tax=Accumulibacter sp. TaxID=2053492 RepID=UPI00287AAB85|nr:hypothetical protein [Accumulibacter sp.]MDS4054378.1 hypothetical protein [Accumulibacter sp.]HMV03942.1 hypothetical protein [Accumulibacter sp.]HMX69503.1 hypothetical protein [Accumulibacter sp.]HNB67331.1 hypothetical protein [Accumulibacter sp.]HNC28031.1 hypothetical protein [Accumulibacter sp.]